MQYVKTCKKSISEFHFSVKFYEIRKKVRIKSFDYIKIYKFESKHFFIRCILFILIKKNTIGNLKFNFLTIICELQKKSKNAKYCNLININKKFVFLFQVQISIFRISSRGRPLKKKFFWTRQYSAAILYFLTKNDTIFGGSKMMKPLK